MRPATDCGKTIVRISQTIRNAVAITISGHRADVLMDTCTINGELMPTNLCVL